MSTPRGGPDSALPVGASPLLAALSAQEAGKGGQGPHVHSFNAPTMLLELAAIAAVAWVGFYPLVFAGLTAVIALTLGARLEFARLQNEMPFYFDRLPSRSALFTGSCRHGSAGQSAARRGRRPADISRYRRRALNWVADLRLHAVSRRADRTLAGHALQARPLRWGYFRLAAPLGPIFSIGICFCRPRIQ